MGKAKPDNSIALNKTAKRNYFLDEIFQAGIVLNGWEVKSLREGKVDIKDSYINIKNNEAYIIGMKIDPPPSLHIDKDNSLRSKKLLLHKKELHQIKAKIEQKGLTCILTRVFISSNLIKVEIAIGRGKKQHDQRETIKQRDWSRQKDRILKNTHR
ncbi:MAG: SsrA-binding protein SmpB [Gammaproteobacteria bacterium]